MTAVEIARDILEDIKARNLKDDQRETDIYVGELRALCNAVIEAEATFLSKMKFSLEHDYNADEWLKKHAGEK